MSFLSPASGAKCLGTRFLRQVHVRVGQQQFAGVRGSLWISRTYTVHEETPAGYAANPDQDILVNNTATCEDDPYAGETANFYNTPLTNLSVSVDSQVDDGTASTSNCEDDATTPNTIIDETIAAGPAPANGDGSGTAEDLVPGTYTCAVVIDP